MKIIIDGTEKEIANLIKEVEGQRCLSQNEIDYIYKGFCRRMLKIKPITLSELAKSQSDICKQNGNIPFEHYMSNH